MIREIVKPITVLLLSVFFLGCKGNSNNASQQVEQSNADVKRTFEQVTVPTVITDPLQRMEYAAAHYWDKFDFTDTAYIHLPEITEQAFANYVGVLSYVSPEVGAPAIKAVLKKAEAEKKMYDYFTGMFEKYLYDPNSPLRNDELYIPVLEGMLEASVLDETYKIRPAHLLELAKKNRVGDKAADFVYTLPNGTTSRLSAVKADYLLLYFYNPDCETCKEYTQMLSSSVLVKDLLQRGTLKILAVYPDENVEEWQTHISEMPTDWIVGRDKELRIRNEEVYDLKAIPMLYLLDKDKKVILKDVTYRDLSDYLASLVK